MQIKEVNYRECCQDQDVALFEDQKHRCIHCGTVFEQEKFTDAAGDTDSRFVKIGGYLEEEASCSMAPIKQEMFIAFIEWILQRYIPQEIVIKIAEEQKEYTGEGYTALQEFICRSLDESRMPAFLTGIGLIEAAEKIATCAGECSLSELDFIKGVMFCKTSVEDSIPF